MNNEQKARLNHSINNFLKVIVVCVGGGILLWILAVGGDEVIYHKCDERVREAVKEEMKWCEKELGKKPNSYIDNIKNERSFD